MKKQFTDITNCPHCKRLSFAPARDSNQFAFSSLDIVPEYVLEQGGMVLGGGTAVQFAYKVCTSCGFLAPFLRKIINQD